MDCATPKKRGGEVEGTLPIAWHLEMPGNAIDTLLAGLGLGGRGNHTDIDSELAC